MSASNSLPTDMLRRELKVEHVRVTSSLALAYLANPEQAHNMSRLFGGTQDKPYTVEEIEKAISPEAAKHYAELQMITGRFRLAVANRVATLRAGEADPSDD